MVNWDFNEPEFDECDGCELCLVPCLNCVGLGYDDDGVCDLCDGDGEVQDFTRHQFVDEDDEYERW